MVIWWEATTTLASTHRLTIAVQQTCYPTTCICLRVIMGSLLSASYPTPVGLSAEASLVQWASYICREKQPVPNKTPSGREKEQCGHVRKAWAIHSSSCDPTQKLLHGLYACQNNPMLTHLMLELHEVRLKQILLHLDNFVCSQHK